MYATQLVVAVLKMTATRSAIVTYTATTTRTTIAVHALYCRTAPYINIWAWGWCMLGFRTAPSAAPPPTRLPDLDKGLPLPTLARTLCVTVVPPPSPLLPPSPPSASSPHLLHPSLPSSLSFLPPSLPASSPTSISDRLPLLPPSPSSPLPPAHVAGPTLLPSLPRRRPPPHPFFPRSPSSIFGRPVLDGSPPPAPRNPPSPRPWLPVGPWVRRGLEFIVVWSLAWPRRSVAQRSKSRRSVTRNGGPQHATMAVCFMGHTNRGSVHPVGGAKDDGGWNGAGGLGFRGRLGWVPAPSGATARHFLRSGCRC